MYLIWDYMFKGKLLHATEIDGDWNRWRSRYEVVCVNDFQTKKYMLSSSRQTLISAEPLQQIKLEKKNYVTIIEKGNLETKYRADHFYKWVQAKHHRVDNPKAMIMIYLLNVLWEHWSCEFNWPTTVSWKSNRSSQEEGIFPVTLTSIPSREFISCIYSYDMVGSLQTVMRRTPHATGRI